MPTNASHSASRLHRYTDTACYEHIDTCISPPKERERERERGREGDSDREKERERGRDGDSDRERERER